jgi:hypothetical protein
MQLRQHGSSAVHPSCTAPSALRIIPKLPTSIRANFYQTLRTEDLHHNPRERQPTPPSIFVKPCKASALFELCTQAYGALSQSSSGVPFIPSHLRLALASGIPRLSRYHPGTAQLYCTLLVRRKLTFLCFRLLHQQNPSVTSGTLTGP